MICWAMDAWIIVMTKNLIGSSFTCPLPGDDDDRIKKLQ